MDDAIPLVAGLDGDPPMFFYGSLRDLDLLAQVAGERPAALRPALVRGRRVVAAPGESFPVLTPAADAAAEGVLVDGLSDAALRRILAYEGEGYRLKPIEVDCDGARVAARCFAPGAAFEARIAALPATTPEWSFDRWRAEEKTAVLAAFAIVAPWIERIGPELAMLLWPDLVGAAENPPSPRLLRPPEAAPDKAGSEAVAPVAAAVAVLGYDPRSELVLLVERWRAGAAMLDPERPWALELPGAPLADAADPREWPSAIASEPEREAARAALSAWAEAVGRQELAARFLAESGGGMTSILVVETTLAEGAVLRALPGDPVAARRIATPLETALTAAARGDVRDATALLAINWLERHRKRLAAIWR